MKIFNYLLCLFVTSVFLSCGGGGGSSGVELKVLISDLGFPVRVEVLDDRHLLLAEVSTGVVFQFNRENSERKDLVSFQAFSAGGAGISGLLVDKDFSSNGFVFVYHTMGEPARNAVSRITVRNGVVEDNRILQMFTQASGHNGGGMYQLSNGNILVGIGDGDVPALAQDLNRLEGKIIVINRNGEMLDVHRGFPRGIYALGFRNPFGIDGNGDGDIYVSDNGPACDDEVNKLQLGGNYSWRAEYQCGVTLSGHVSPIYVWDVSEGITDLAYFPSKKTLVTALYNKNTLVSLTLNSAGTQVREQKELLALDEPIVGIQRGYNDEILFTTPTRVYSFRVEFSDPAQEFRPPL